MTIFIAIKLLVTTAKIVKTIHTVSYTHLTLPTN